MSPKSKPLSESTINNESFKKRRRQFLQVAGVGAVGSMLFTSSAHAAAQSYSPNLIYVGEGADFHNIKLALASITDNSASNPYVIHVLPGVYDSFTMKNHVDIVGSGVNSTVIETDSANPIVVASNTSLQKMKVHFSGTGGGAGYTGAIIKRSDISELILSDLEIHVDNITGADGPRFGIYIVNGGHNMIIRNTKIKTESGGVHLSSGNYRFHGCDIYLVGDGVGLPRYGLYIQKSARVDWSGGRICTGYYYPDIANDTDQDVICVYIPELNNYGCRVEVHDAEMFARNANAQSGVKVNAVRAENGWVRLFGCFAQTELSENVNSNTSKTVFGAFGTEDEPLSGKKGKIEVHGTRLSSQQGNTLGGNMMGVATYSQDIYLEKWEGGLIRCDASSGEMTIRLPWANLNKPSGEIHHFIKVDDSNYKVNINLNGATYFGSSKNPVLQHKYDAVKLIWDGTEWVSG